MDTQLPSRPNLDHLRRQAKSLLASLAAGDPDAPRAFQEHLPAAKGMSDAQVRAAGFRLADAQSAVARRTGFASWPQLARHIEQLRALEGSWSFDSLEVEGTPVPPAGMVSSRLLIDGDRFRMESPEATYEGVFNIDVEADPHHIDIEFVEGPEAGNWNYGIFRLGGDSLEFCLDMQGKPRPKGFRTTPGSGHAYEVLRRESGSRPGNVTGGNRAAGPPAAGVGAPPDTAGFALVASATLTKLQGNWAARKIVRDGQELPAFMLATARRSATGNEVSISVGGVLITRAMVRIDESAQPIQIDYLNLEGPAKGSVQQGIMEWRDGGACFCMGAPGQQRPTDFESLAGSCRTLSVWMKI